MIKFTRDYRGKITNEVFYTKGTEVDLPEEIENYLVDVVDAAQRVETKSKKSAAKKTDDK